MYFSTDSQQTVRWLAAVIATAAKNEQRIRIDVDSLGKLRVKRGEGGWSAPIESSRDPYRDGSPEQQQRPALYVGDHGEPVVRPLLTGVEDAPKFSDPLVEAAYHGQALTAGECNSHDGVHGFQNDPDPCIDWSDVAYYGD